MANQNQVQVVNVPDNNYLGPANNAANWNNVLAPDQNLAFLFARNVNAYPLNGNFEAQEVPRVLTTILNGIYIADNKRADIDLIESRVALELYGINGAVNDYMTEEQSHQLICKSATGYMRRLFIDNAEIPRCDFGQLDFVRGFGVDDNGDEIVMLDQQPDLEFRDLIERPATTSSGSAAGTSGLSGQSSQQGTSSGAERVEPVGHASIQYAQQGHRWFYRFPQRCVQLQPGAGYLPFPIAFGVIRVIARGLMRGRPNLYYAASAMVSLARRGVINRVHAKKISDGLEEEVGVVVDLNPNVIHRIWPWMQAHVDGDNIQVLIQRLTVLFPVNSLVMRNLMIQTAGTGLTAYITIGRAFRIHPRFPWNIASSLLPGQFDNFAVALGLIGDNPYYGYNSDLRAAKSTNYKDLAWVAKELLIRIDGQNTLTNYQGWTANPRNRGQLDELINNYANRPADPANVVPIDPAILRNIAGNNLFTQ